MDENSFLHDQGLIQLPSAFVRIFANMHACSSAILYYPLVQRLSGILSTYQRAFGLLDDVLLPVSTSLCLCIPIYTHAQNPSPSFTVSLYRAFLNLSLSFTLSLYEAVYLLVYLNNSCTHLVFKPHIIFSLLSFPCHLHT